MFEISDELRAFIESDVSVLIGAVDEHGHPQLAYVWGPRVHEDARTLSVYVSRDRSAALLGGTAEHPLLAVTFTDAISLRSIQVKGRFVRTNDPNEAELAWVDRHRQAFTTATSLVGDPPHVVRNLWTADVLRVDLIVERAFDQTPGPNAGMPL